MKKTNMTLVEHLTEFRKRILYTFFVFLLLLSLGIGFVSKIYSYLVTPLRDAGYRLIIMSPGEVIPVYLSLSGIVAIALTLPIALYQIWQFVAPGLTVVERKYTLRLLPVTFVMFLLGISFAWFITFPMILHFLLRIGSQQFAVMIRAGEYFSFLTSICLPFGLIFELPVAVVFLTRLGVISPRVLKKARRYAYVVIVILGVLISPPELISHLSVVLPMALLYELSCVLSTIVQKRVEKSTVHGIVSSI